MPAEKSISPSIRERAQRNHSEILRALQATKQEVVADLVGCDPSTITRLKDDYLERLAAVLAAIGRKVVPEDVLQVDPREYQAIALIASKRMLELGQPSGFGELPGP